MRYPPIRVSWLLDLLPVVSGDRLVPLLIPIGGRYDSEPVPTDGELVLLYGNLVDVEHFPPLVLAENKPFLLSAPAFGVQILKSVKAGRIRGLLLA